MNQVCRYVLLFLITGLLSAQVRADAFGAADSIEIAKLTEIITQMTTLIERTEDYINLQQRLAETQERAFFRKSNVYAGEIRKLVSSADTLEETARAAASDPLKLGAIYRDAKEIRDLANRATRGNTREVLLGIADMLDMIAETEWLVGTADATEKEMAYKQDASAEGQLLAGIYRTMADMNAHTVRDETRYRLRALSHRQQVLGMYSVFDDAQ